MDQKEKVLALLDRARKHWDENPPSPPSDRAARLAQKYIRLEPDRPGRRRANRQ